MQLVFFVVCKREELSHDIHLLLDQVFFVHFLKLHPISENVPIKMRIPINQPFCMTLSTYTNMSVYIRLTALTVVARIDYADDAIIFLTLT